jgi:hypothetical protein
LNESPEHPESGFPLPEWLAAPPPLSGALELTRDRLAADLIDALVTEVQQQPRPWPQLSQTAQQEVIDRLAARCRHLMAEAVRIIASDGRQCLVADVDSVTAKDGIKVVLKIDGRAPGRHELMDSTGDQVLVILGGTDFTGAPPRSEGEPLQRGLC